LGGEVARIEQAVQAGSAGLVYREHRGGGRREAGGDARLNAARRGALLQEIERIGLQTGIVPDDDDHLHVGADGVHRRRDGFGAGVVQVLSNFHPRAGKGGAGEFPGFARAGGVGYEGEVGPHPLGRQFEAHGGGRRPARRGQASLAIAVSRCRLRLGMAKQNQRLHIRVPPRARAV
jgi:hypothetical protein